MAETVTSSGREPSRRGTIAGPADVSRNAPSPRTAKAVEYLPGPATSCLRAGSARLSLIRCSANATGHQRVTGRSPSSTAAASGSHAPSRTSAKIASLKASASGGDALSSSGCRPLTEACRTYSAATAPTAAAASLAPMRPSASAARPRTIGAGSVRSGVSAAAAEASPIKPSAKAAACFTSASVSPSSPVSGVTASARPTRPSASAARRRMRASASVIRTVRSPVGGGVGRHLWCASAPHRLHRRRRRRFVAEDSSIFELEDPGHLLLERDRRRPFHRRRRGLARGGEKRSQRKTRPPSGAPSKIGAHSWIHYVERSSSLSSVAASIRSWTIVTPMPGPVGTATVPSARTSISGSIRSGE